MKSEWEGKSHIPIPLVIVSHRTRRSMWGEPSNRERIKVQKIIFKEGGSEVCPWTMLKQWFPKWSVFTQRGTQDNPFEGRKYFSFY